MTTDHRGCAPPRGAANIDVVRCCCVFADAGGLRHGAAALRGAFRAVRLKNGFAPGSAAEFGYRCLLLNVLHDTGRAMGDAAADAAVRERWARLRGRWTQMGADVGCLDDAAAWMAGAGAGHACRVVGEAQLSDLWWDTYAAEQAARAGI
eukprot:gene10314-3267_t